MGGKLGTAAGTETYLRVAGVSGEGLGACVAGERDGGETSFRSDDCRVACARCSWERAENWALLISAVVRPSTGSVVIHRPSEPESQFLVAQRNSKKCVRPCTCKRNKR